MTMWDFATQAGRDFEREADRASLLVEALTRSEASSQLLPMLPGAGLVAHRGQPVITLLADPAALSASTPAAPLRIGASVFLAQTPLLDTIRSLLGTSDDWVRSIEVLAVPTPEQQSAIYAAPNTGKAGARVRWNAGQGFMTAGHVATTAGTWVTDPGSKTVVGAVKWANDPAKTGTAIEPDLSIVEDANGFTVGTSFATKAKAGPSDTVTVAATGASDIVMGFMGYLYMPAQNQTLGDCYMSSNQITHYGDSGSPVVRGNDIIGHVVGASAGFASYFQDISYLLTEGANRLRKGLAGLRL